MDIDTTDTLAQAPPHVLEELPMVDGQITPLGWESVTAWIEDWVALETK